MSNLWLNWRFGEYHLQIGPDRPWVRWSHNFYHAEARKKPGWKWFQIH